MPYSTRQRYAVYTVHLEQCWICSRPLSFSETEVDHILPKSLKCSASLPKILESFGLPAHFNLNSYENWMPACRRCNSRKQATVFEPSPLIQLCLQKAAERAPRARELEESLGRKGDLDRSLTNILLAHEAGQLTAEQRRAVAVVLEFHEQNRQPDQRGKPFRLAPWLNVLGSDGGMLLLQNRSGLVGYRPVGDKVDLSFDCPNCGPTGWNGTRCISCGMLIDPE